MTFLVMILKLLINYVKMIFLKSTLSRIIYQEIFLSKKGEDVQDPGRDQGPALGTRALAQTDRHPALAHVLRLPHHPDGGLIAS